MMSFPHGTVFHPQMAAAAVASTATGGVAYPGQPQAPQQLQQRTVVSTTTAPMNMMATAPAVAAMGQPTFIYQVLMHIVPPVPPLLCGMTNVLLGLVRVMWDSV